MNFLHPLIAAAAVAGVSIPILIHILMRRRRKPVMWAAMRFLLEAYKQQRRRLRLEQLLLLAARCLVIVLAGLAIARPMLGRAGILGGRGSVTLYLLIDNGLASSVTAPGAIKETDSALARHKAAALALLEQLDPGAGDRAGLIALGGPAQPLVVPPSTGIAALRDSVSGLASTDSATDIAGALAVVRSALDAAGSADPGGRTIVAILSEFLAGSADTQRKLTELVDPSRTNRAEIALLASQPAESAPGNIAITGLEPLQPIIIAPKKDNTARQTPVRIHLRRSGEAGAAVSSVRFSVQSPGAQTPTSAGQTTVRWAPGQAEASATTSVDVSAVGNALSGSIILSAAIDPDSVAGDNTWRRPIEARPSLRIGLIAPRRPAPRTGPSQYEPADWFRLALQPVDPGTSEAEMEIVDIEPEAVDAPRLAGLDAAIIARPDAVSEASWRRLRAFADAGGLIFITPPAQATVHLWADAMMRELGLPWTAAREAKSYSPATTVTAERSAAGGVRDILAMLDAEMQDFLVRPVRVLKVLPIDDGAKGTGALLKLADGTPLLLAAPPAGKETEATQRGLVVLLASALSFEWTDLQTKPLMVALMQELVRQGVGRARGTYSDLAGSQPELPPRAIELRAIGPTGLIKAASGRAAEPIRSAGLWRAVDESGASRGILAVNADPAAGRTETQPSAAISAWLASANAGQEVRWLSADRTIGGAGSIQAALQQRDDAGRATLILLIAALALALLELLMARWFSHAGVTPTGAPA